MAGSPKKRAKREAAQRAKQIADSSVVERPPSAGEVAGSTPAPQHQPVPEPMRGEILPPVGAEPTRTALKRAMRTRAQEHAEEAIAVLVENMRNTKLPAEKRESAANKLLEWGFGKPGIELEAGEGGLLVTIQKFGAQE